MAVLNAPRLPSLRSQGRRRRPFRRRPRRPRRLRRVRRRSGLCFRLDQADRRREPHSARRDPERLRRRQACRPGYRPRGEGDTDYILPNKDTTSGAVDANYFQHINYPENYNKENGTDLVSVGAIHYEPMAVYAGKSSDLDSIADGASIAIPNDPTNEGRALLLLQDLGLITLSDPQEPRGDPQRHRR